MLGRMSTTFEIPTLRTDRSTLRAFQAADLDALAVMQANPEVRRFLGGNLLTRAEAWSSMERMLGQWALRGYGMFAGRGRGTLRRLGRRAASAGMAGTGAGVFARSAILGSRHRHRSGSRGARVGLRAARRRAAGKLHHAGQRAIGSRGGETWRGARWRDYDTRLRWWIGGCIGNDRTVGAGRTFAGARAARDRAVGPVAHRRSCRSRDSAQPGAARSAGERTGPAHRMGHRHRRRDRTPVGRAGCHRGAADLFAPGDRLQPRSRRCRVRSRR